MLLKGVLGGVIEGCTRGLQVCGKCASCYEVLFDVHVGIARSLVNSLAIWLLTGPKVHSLAIWLLTGPKVYSLAIWLLTGPKVHSLVIWLLTGPKVHSLPTWLLTGPKALNYFFVFTRMSIGRLMSNVVPRVQLYTRMCIAKRFLPFGYLRDLNGTDM